MSTAAPGKRAGTEPDYRMTLAAERTYLAYVRTALALLAAGVAVAAALPDAGAEDLRRVLGGVLVLLGLGIGATARIRYQAVDRAMRGGEPLPRLAIVTPMTAVLVLVALGALVVVAVA